MAYTIVGRIHCEGCTTARRAAFRRFGLFQCSRRSDALLLGTDDPQVGWLMESYHWLWESELVRSFHAFLLARRSTPVQLWERGAFGDALRPNETGREPFVRGGLLPDGVACRTKLMIEQTYPKFLRLLATRGRERGRPVAPLNSTSTSAGHRTSSRMAGGGARRPRDLLDRAPMAAAELQQAAARARRYTFVSTADLASEIRLPLSVATANVDNGECSFGECLTALLPRMSEGQAATAADFLRRHRVPTLSPRPARNRSCVYCPPPRRPLTPTEAAFLDRSRVSFLTSGGLNDGPFVQHARALNGLPPTHVSRWAQRAGPRHPPQVREGQAQLCSMT